MAFVSNTLGGAAYGGQVVETLGVANTLGGAAYGGQVVETLGYGGAYGGQVVEAVGYGGAYGGQVVETLGYGGAYGGQGDQLPYINLVNIPGEALVGTMAQPGGTFSSADGFF